MKGEVRLIHHDWLEGYAMNNNAQKARAPELLEQVLQAFAETTGLQGKVLTRATPAQRRTGADASVRFGRGKERWDFSVELRNQLTSRNLGAVVAELRRLQPRGVLVTPFVTMQQAEKLLELNVPFLDAAGNAFLNEPQLFVFVNGKRRTEAHPADQNFSRAFRPSGLGILFAMLCHPGLEAKPLREIATAAGVSLGAVGWEMKQLEQAGYLLNLGAHGRSLTKQADLLKRWVEAYQERWRPKLLLARCSASRPNWWKGKEGRLKELNACWGGEVAAEKLTGYLKPQTQTLYTSGTAKDLQIEFGLKRDPQGNIEILKTFWSFDHPARKRNLTPELLVYADLLASADERNLATARIIYDQYLVRLIGEAAA